MIAQKLLSMLITIWNSADLETSSHSVISPPHSSTAPIHHQSRLGSRFVYALVVLALVGIESEGKKKLGESFVRPPNSFVQRVNANYNVE